MGQHGVHSGGQAASLHAHTYPSVAGGVEDVYMEKHAVFLIRRRNVSVLFWSVSLILSNLHLKEIFVII